MLIELFMKDVEYNPAEIQKSAKQLYAKSYLALIVWPFIGLFIAYVLESELLHDRYYLYVIGVILGYLYGSLRSVRYRMQVQLALCNLQIEVNTRTDEN
jgi:hypothetical protein